MVIEEWLDRDLNLLFSFLKCQQHQAETQITRVHVLALPLSSWGIWASSGIFLNINIITYRTGIKKNKTKN